MDHQSASSAVLSGDARTIAGDAIPYSASAGNAADQKAKNLKTRLLDLLPPATVALVILFWAYGPPALLKNPWTIVVTGLAITFFVQALEWVHERHEGWRIDKREFLTDAFYIALSYTVISWATVTLAEDPLKAVKQSLGITTEWATHLPFLAQAALVVFLVEFGQYWMHRAMHKWEPLWLTHAPHHHLTQLNAMKGAVGNPIELFLITLSVVALFDFDEAAIFCAINITGVISTFAHANVRSDPPLFYSYFFTTIRHHSLHHSTGYEETRRNFGNSLILLDRVFGTYREGEGIIVGQDERKRLSIPEQFIFPFRPLIEKFKAQRGASASVAG